MDHNRSLSICAVVNVGSHLLTLNRIKGALDNLSVVADFTILDIVGFNRWNALGCAFAGEAKRLQFKPSDCGLPGGVFSRAHWRRLNLHALEVLRAANADLLLAMVDQEYPNWALFNAARRLGIDTLLVQEGPYPHDRILHRPQHRDWRYARAIVARLLGLRPPFGPAYGSACRSSIAAVSAAYRDLFAEAGADPESIVVTGAPRFDVLPMIKKARLKHSLRDRAGHIEALFVSQPFLTYGMMTVQQTRSLYLEMLAARQNLGEAFVFDLRFHPSESQEERELKMDVLRPGIRDLDHCQDISQSFLKYDLLVGSHSTVMLEGMAAGLAVGILDSGIPRLANQFTSAGIRGATAAKELSLMCLQILRENPTTREWPLLAREMGEMDGRASERVARLIVDLVQARRGRP